jgi:hypothetical protein
VKKESLQRVGKLEDIFLPPPSATFVFFSKEKFPVPLGEENPARLFAWAELRDQWHARQVAEAERTYDRSKYAAFIAVSPGYELKPGALAERFKRDLANNLFTAEAYLNELAEAEQWSQRNGFNKPSNFIEIQVFKD